MKNLAGVTLAKVWVQFVTAQNSKWPPSASLIFMLNGLAGIYCCLVVVVNEEEENIGKEEDNKKRINERPLWAYSHYGDMHKNRGGGGKWISNVINWAEFWNFRKCFGENVHFKHINMAATRVLYIALYTSTRWLHVYYVSPWKQPDAPHTLEYTLTVLLWRPCCISIVDPLISIEKKIQSIMYSLD